MRGFLWVVRIAALGTMVLGGVVVADGEVSDLPLRGPISFEAFDLDGSGAISQGEYDQTHARRDGVRKQAGLPPSGRRHAFGDVDGDGDGSLGPEEFAEAVKGHWQGGGHGAPDAVEP